MPRPVKPRWVEFSPGVSYFKPAGIRMRDLEEVILGLDEVEALRLKDLIGLEQEQCAERIIATHLQRVGAARNKVAGSLKAKSQNEGNYLISPLIFTCTMCGSHWKNEDRYLSDPECPECGSKDVVSARGHSDQFHTVGPAPTPGGDPAGSPFGGPGSGRRRRMGSRHRHGHGRGNGPGNRAT